VAKDITVTLELEPSIALALAQFCKRIGWQDCVTNSVSDAEAYEMLDGLGTLRLALRDAGFDPR